MLLTIAILGISLLGLAYLLTAGTHYGPKGMSWPSRHKALYTVALVIATAAYLYEVWHLDKLLVR